MSESQRRRRRRRTRHHPVRRRRRILLLSAAGVLGVVAVLAAIVGWDAVKVRSELSSAREQVAAVPGALAEGDVEAAETRLTAAQDAVDAASRRTNRLLWRTAESVPLAGRSFRTVSGVVNVSEAAIDVGRQAIRKAGGLVGDGGDLEIEVEDAQVSLDSVDLASASLAQIDLDRLERAVDELDALPMTWVPEQVRDGRRQALDLGRQATGSISNAGSLLEVLPGFLGEDGPRRYFLAMQNNAELRGTGGLIGVFGILSVDDGRFTLETTEKVNVLYRDAEDRELPPVAAAEAFEQRYSSINAAGFFTNTNVDPDLPTDGPVMVDLYRQRRGEPIDGVIAMDPIGLSLVLGDVGPVDVPDELLTGFPDVPDPVPAGDIPRVTMVDAVSTFGDPAADEDASQDEFILGFAEAAFQRVFAGGWDAIPVGRRLAEAAAGRHLQLYSAEESEQEIFERVGIAGKMEARSASGSSDLVAVTANNAAANKQDVHVGHSLVGQLRVLPDGDGWRREATLRVGLENALPSSGLDPVILQNKVTASQRAFGREPIYDGSNRTWFTVWSPESTVLLEARDAAGEELLVGVGQIHGEQAVDHFLETESQSSNHFEVDLAGPIEVTREGPDLVYRLTVWRQAKAVPDRLDLSIEGPRGWNVAEVSLAGGGDGGGMGPYGDVGPEVASSLEGGVVNVAGDVNRDLHIEIRYTKPLRDRLVDWLRRPAF